MRPLGTPEWANDLSNIVEPSQGKKDAGHVPNETPAAGTENWLKNILSGYARAQANTAFAQVRGAFVTGVAGNTADFAISIIYDETTTGSDNAVEVWLLLNSAGKYNLVSDPYGKQTGTQYEEGDLPASSDAIGLTAAVYNGSFARWIVGGNNSITAPYALEPKLAFSTVRFPKVSGDWTAVNTSLGLNTNITGLDWCVGTGTTLASIRDVAGLITVLRSTDGGTNWTDVSPTTVMDTARSVYCPKATSNAAAGDLVVFGTNGLDVSGIFSDDDGLTWTDIAVSGSSSVTGAGEATAVCHNGRVWAAIHHHTDAIEVYTSADGLNWGTTALPATVGQPNDIAADEDGGLIFILSDNGFFYSENDGQSWKRAAPLQSPDPGVNGELGPTVSRMRIKVSPTGQIGLVGRVDGDPVVWWTPRQISRDFSYENPDL